MNAINDMKDKQTVKENKERIINRLKNKYNALPKKEIYTLPKDFFHKFLLLIYNRQ